MAGYFDQIVDSIAVAYVGLQLAAILLFLAIMQDSGLDRQVRKQKSLSAWQ